jgi:hypothetical protein
VVDPALVGDGAVSRRQPEENLDVGCAEIFRVNGALSSAARSPASSTAAEE